MKEYIVKIENVVFIVKFSLNFWLDLDGVWCLVALDPLNDDTCPLLDACYYPNKSSATKHYTQDIVLTNSMRIKSLLTLN